MKNKKGAEMTIGTIIVIILALVVLVILVYGFSTGWTNLWDKVTNFGGGKANVQTIVQSCQLACTTLSEYDYCKTRSMIEVDSAGKIQPAREITCKVLEYGNYGLEPCDSISCKNTTKTEDEMTAITKLKCETITTESVCNADTDCSWDKTTAPEKCIVKA
ncbi:MAG: hypothetical protein WCX73_05165 [Candidatus Pacearchaeota archaeon]|jgi:hypothetical protein